MYSAWAFFVAVMAAEIPWLVLSLFTGPVASYFLIGLGSNSTEFFTSFLTLFVLSLLFVLIAKTTATLLPNFELAQSFTGIVMPILMDFSGLYGKVRPHFIFYCVVIKFYVNFYTSYDSRMPC
jgi:hypothetical protein